MFIIPSEYDQMKRREGFDDRFLAIIYLYEIWKDVLFWCTKRDIMESEAMISFRMLKNISQWAIVTSLYECGEDE